MDETDSIFDFINSYLEWLDYESQEIPSRTYSDSVKLNYVISELQRLENPSFNMAIHYLMSRRDIIFCDPMRPLPLPKDLQLDRISNTIIDQIQENAREDILNIQRRLVRVNKITTRSQHQFNKQNMNHANSYT